MKRAHQLVCSPEGIVQQQVTVHPVGQRALSMKEQASALVCQLKFKLEFAETPNLMPLAALGGFGDVFTVCHPTYHRTWKVSVLKI